MTKEGRMQRALTYHYKLGVDPKKGGITKEFYEAQLGSIFKGVPHERAEFDKNLEVIKEEPKEDDKKTSKKGGK